MPPYSKAKKYSKSICKGEQQKITGVGDSAYAAKFSPAG